MRLIDADMLKAEFTGNFQKEYGVSQIKAMIDVRPTIEAEPVRHGRWVLECDPNGNPYCFHCSVCDSDSHHIGVTIASDYCPNCGARMDGKGGENEQV